MTAVRRWVLRQSTATSTPATSRQRDRWQRQLATDHQALRRWMTKLKRAFNTVDRLQTHIGRLERKLSQAG